MAEWVDHPCWLFARNRWGLGSNPNAVFSSFFLSLSELLMFAAVVQRLRCSAADPKGTGLTAAPAFLNKAKMLEARVLGFRCTLRT